MAITRPLAHPYRVVRNCCTSGNCIACISSPGHKFGTSIQIVHAEGLTKERATEVAKGYRDYGAYVQAQR